MVAGPKQSNTGAAQSALAHDDDILGYFCDIISELKALADRSGQRTLAAILASALVEARIQKDNDSL